MKEIILKLTGNFIFSFLYLSIFPINKMIENLTSVEVKFILLGIAVPFVSIYMLYNDENNINPKVSDAVVTYFLSIIFIWIGYELFNYVKLPIFLGLLSSFFLGISSLPIAIKGREIFIDSFMQLIKDAFSKASEKLKKLF